jgi:hypothetical protein
MAGGVTLEQLLAEAKHSEECMCRYNGDIGIIEKVYRGRGIRRQHVRAKIMLDTRVLYVDFDEIEPF